MSEKQAQPKGAEAANIELAAANASIEKAFDTLLHAVSALTTKIDMVTVEQANQIGSHKWPSSS